MVFDDGKRYYKFFSFESVHELIEEDKLLYFCLLMFSFVLKIRISRKKCFFKRDCLPIK